MFYLVIFNLPVFILKNMLIQHLTNKPACTELVKFNGNPDTAAPSITVHFNYWSNNSLHPCLLFMHVIMCICVLFLSLNQDSVTMSFLKVTAVFVCMCVWVCNNVSSSRCPKTNREFFWQGSKQKPQIYCWLFLLLKAGVCFYRAHMLHNKKKKISLHHDCLH